MGHPAAADVKTINGQVVGMYITITVHDHCKYNL